MHSSNLRLFSVVIPARDEQDTLVPTIKKLSEVLSLENITHEIVVVNDGSRDRTWDLLQELQGRIPSLRPVNNTGPHGFGCAVRAGLHVMRGDAVVIMMADGSDEPADAVKYWRMLNEGWDAVFGSRFMKGGRVVDYPFPKLVVNRIANWCIRVLFGISLNDTTNAFKAYSRRAIEGCMPLLAPHFNLTVELPLKTIVRGFSWTVVPISWRNRSAGVSKLKLKEMGSRYFFICAYVWLEKHFSRGDYRRKSAPNRPPDSRP